jgi:membrane-associated protease RseP (regulator of RpoE activity)
LKILSEAGISVVNVYSYTANKSINVIDIVIDRVLGESEFKRIYIEIIDKTGYAPLQLRTKPPIIRLIPVRKGGRRILLLSLLATTLVTIFLTGLGISAIYLQILGSYTSSSLLLLSLSYTFLFMFALAIHEYGHMLAARRDRVIINGPYFIPAPPIQLGFIGTLGAVISMKNLPPDRKGLARLGIAGPLTGYVAGLIIAIIGVALSPIVSVSSIKGAVENGEVSEIGFMPITLQLLMHLKPVSPGYTILLHPFALIGFIVFIVTFLNLIPIGQLDGGHVIRAYTSSRSHEIIGYVSIILVFLAGLLLPGDASTYYLTLTIVLVVLKLIVGRYPHPGPSNQYAEEKDYLYLALYVILLLLTIPLPNIL